MPRDPAPPPAGGQGEGLEQSLPAGWVTESDTHVAEQTGLALSDVVLRRKLHESAAAELEATHWKMLVETLDPQPPRQPEGEPADIDRFIARVRGEDPRDVARGRREHGLGETFTGWTPRQRAAFIAVLVRRTGRRRYSCSPSPEVRALGLDELVVLSAGRLPDVTPTATPTTTT